MDINKRIENVKIMEDKFDKACDAVEKLTEALDNYLAVKDNIEALESYYTSPLWMSDYTDDENGIFPEDLKRGVLSQDAIYNLLCDNSELLEKIKKSF